MQDSLLQKPCAERTDEDDSWLLPEKCKEDGHVRRYLSQVLETYWLHPRLRPFGMPMLLFLKSIFCPARDTPSSCARVYEHPFLYTRYNLLERSLAYSVLYSRGFAPTRCFNFCFVFCEHTHTAWAWPVSTCRQGSYVTLSRYWYHLGRGTWQNFARGEWKRKHYITSLSVVGSFCRAGS